MIDDHVYMPLQRVYEAAAEYNYDSTALTTVQQLLLISTQIAKKNSQEVTEIYPIYCSFSGCWSYQRVKTSSIPDMEFQVYLWVCTLQGSIAAIQQELLTLCVMLYRTLKVHWELIKASALAGIGKSQHLNAIFSSVMAYVQTRSLVKSFD